MEQELLDLENEFGRVVSNNDVEGIERLVTDDWVIIDPDGTIIDKARFLEVIKSGVLSHDSMESTDMRVRVYGSTAVVTALTTTHGKFLGQEFTSCERATDVFVKADRWRCVLTQLTRFTKK
jgi:hypothetical protein